MSPVDNRKCRAKAPGKEVRASRSDQKAIISSVGDSLSQGSKREPPGEQLKEREPTKVSSQRNPEWVTTLGRSERQEENQETVAIWKPREFKTDTGFSASEVQSGGFLK